MKLRILGGYLEVEPVEDQPETGDNFLLEGEDFTITLEDKNYLLSKEYDERRIKGGH